MCVWGGCRIGEQGCWLLHRRSGRWWLSHRRVCVCVGGGCRIGEQGCWLLHRRSGRWWLSHRRVCVCVGGVSHRRAGVLVVT